MCRKCQYQDCCKSAQSPTPFCVRHGGGRKCSLEGCTKVARGKTSFCASHGGGYRCIVADCCRPVQGNYRRCKAHQLMDDVDDLKFSTPSLGFSVLADGDTIASILKSSLVLPCRVDSHSNTSNLSTSSIASTTDEEDSMAGDEDDDVDDDDVDGVSDDDQSHNR